MRLLRLCMHALFRPRRAGSRKARPIVFYDPALMQMARRRRRSMRYIFLKSGSTSCLFKRRGAPVGSQNFTKWRLWNSERANISLRYRACVCLCKFIRPIQMLIPARARSNALIQMPLRLKNSPPPHPPALSLKKSLVFQITPARETH